MGAIGFAAFIRTFNGQYKESNELYHRLARHFGLSDSAFWILYALREAEGFRLDEGFLEAIRPGVGMVFLCEPNNPTGLTSPRPLLLRVLERCRQAEFC